MSFHVALSLQMTHAYWEDETAPVRIVPQSATDFARLGLLAKVGNARLDILADSNEVTEDLTVTLAVIADDRDMFALTAGADWATLPFIDLTDGTANVEAALPDVIRADPAPRGPRDPLMFVDVTIPASGQRDVIVHLPSVDAIWAYHIVGKKSDGPLRITDQNAKVDFEDAGRTSLPDGRAARILRSTTPIAMRHRANTRFALEQTQDGPFDPITLIPVLPTAGVNLRPTTDQSAASPLQSDIFVSLW